MRDFKIVGACLVVLGSEGPLTLHENGFPAPVPYLECLLSRAIRSRIFIISTGVSPEGASFFEPVINVRKLKIEDHHESFASFSQIMWRSRGYAWSGHEHRASDGLHAYGVIVPVGSGEPKVSCIRRSSQWPR